MATIRVSLVTPEELRALTILTDVYNKSQPPVGDPPEPPTPITRLAYAEMQFALVLQRWVDHESEVTLSDVREAYRKAPEATKTQINTLLGL
jgi:hypothetical protein